MTGKIKLNAASGGGSVSLQAPSSSGNDRVYTVPDIGSDGTLATTATAGKILQVVSANKTTVQSTSSTSFVDVTDMTAAITPSSSSNKVLIMMTMTIQKSDYTFFARLLRDSTEIGSSSGSNNGISVYNSNDSSQNEGRTVIFLDSPNTTSATTYKLQIKSDGSSTIYFNAHSSGTTSSYITPSSITLMEVAA